MRNSSAHVGLSARPELREQPSQQLHDEKSRKGSAARERQRRRGHHFADFRPGFVSRHALCFIRFDRQIARPEKIQIFAARIAHSAMALRMRAVRALENQRGVAMHAELHAVRIRRAAFWAIHALILPRARPATRPLLRRCRRLVNTTAARLLSFFLASCFPCEYKSRIVLRSLIFK